VSGKLVAELDKGRVHQWKPLWVLLIYFNLPIEA
jgi:hypothetical protein